MLDAAQLEEQSEDCETRPGDHGDVICQSHADDTLAIIFVAGSRGILS